MNTELLWQWAENHSPRTKQLARQYRNLLEAAKADEKIKLDACNVARGLYSDLGSIGWKLLQRDIMEEREIRVLTAALLNTKLFEQVINQNKTREEVLSLAEEVFAAVEGIVPGVKPELIEDMRKNLHATLEVKSHEEAILADG